MMYGQYLYVSRGAIFPYTSNRPHPQVQYSVGGKP
jgi:hypothetical protein